MDYSFKFKLSGRSDSTFQKTFDNMNKNLGSINERMKELNSTKMDITSALKLEEKISSLSNEYNELSRANKELQDKLKFSNSAVKESEIAYSQAKQELENYRNSLEKGKQRTEEQKAKIEQLNLKVKESREAFQNATKEHKSLNTQAERTTRKTETLSGKIESQSDRLKTLKDKLKSAGVETNNLAEEDKKLSSEIEKVNKKMQAQEAAANIQQKALHGRMQAREKMFTAVEQAMILKKPINSAMQFESAMADVKKVVDFDNENQFGQMGKDIVNLSKKIPMAADGIADIVAAGGQSGINKNDLVNFAEDAAKMGIAFDITAEEAGQSMAQWRTAFKMNQSEVKTLADRINYLGNTTAASAPIISNIVSRIGPLGEVGGAASESIAALGATMAGTGISEEIASTGIKNLILNLTKGESATAKQAQAFKDLGFTSTGMAKAMQEDANKAILSVLKSISKLDKDKQSSMLTSLFGSESVGAIAPLLTNIGQLEENFNKVADATQYAGSMQKEYDSIASTTANKFELVKNKASAFGITIGNTLLPSLAKTFDSTGKVIDKLDAFAQKHPKLVSGVVKFTAALLGGAIAFSALKYGATIIAAPFTDCWALMVKMGVVTEGLTAKQALLTISQKAGAVATGILTGAQKLLNLALTMNPVGLVIGVIAALGAAIYIAYQKSEKFREGVQNLWKKLKELFSLKKPAWLDEFQNSESVQNAYAMKTGQPAPKGRNAVGTNYWRGGLTMVGENGPELINLRKGASIASAAKSSALMGKSLNLTYSPTIVMSPNANKRDIDSALDMSYAKFKNYAERLERDNDRVSFV